MRGAFISLFVFSFLMAAWVLFAQATGRPADPIPVPESDVRFLERGPIGVVQAGAVGPEGR